MTKTTDKKPIEFYRAQPDRYSVSDAGLVYDLEAKRIVTQYAELNPNAITKENTHAMHARKREIMKQAEIRSLARKAGIDVDNATAEELAQGAATAYEAVIGHGYDLLMKATTPRGFEGLFSQFRAMLSEDPRARETLPPGQGIIAPVPALMELVEQIMEKQQNAVEQARAIPADWKDD